MLHSTELELKKPLLKVIPPTPDDLAAFNFASNFQRQYFDSLTSYQGSIDYKDLVACSNLTFMTLFISSSGRKYFDLFHQKIF